MEEQKKSKWMIFRDSIFRIFTEVLKNKKTGTYQGCILIIICFIQINGFLFDKDLEMDWEDETFLSYTQTIIGIIKVLPGIKQGKMIGLYWVIYISGIIQILLFLGIMGYIRQSEKRGYHSMEWPRELIKANIPLFYWVLFSPMYEANIFIFKCEDGHHYIDTSMACYEGYHIILIVISIIFSILLISSLHLFDLFLQNTHPNPEDALAKALGPFDLEVNILRIIVPILVLILSKTACQISLMILILFGGILLSFQYYKNIPYFNRQVSVWFGSCVVSTGWVGLNAVIMSILSFHGHVTVIIAVIPLIFCLLWNIRKKRAEYFAILNVTNLSSSNLGLLKLNTLMSNIHIGRQGGEKGIGLRVIGIIQAHERDCNKEGCVLHDMHRLYDGSLHAYAISTSKGSPQTNSIYMKYFVMKQFEETAIAIINSPDILIAFAYFMFRELKNIPMAYTYLTKAKTKKIGIQHTFTIFRYITLLEEMTKEENSKGNGEYSQLSSLIKFEDYTKLLQTNIGILSQIQLEFWMRLKEYPENLQSLNLCQINLNKKVEQVEKIWKQIVAINSTHNKARNIYAKYISILRNDLTKAQQIVENNEDLVAADLENLGKTRSELLDNNTLLFEDDIGILHISGSKDHLGKITAINEGLEQIFGYKKSELLQTTINTLMPSLYASVHNQMLLHFFRNGNSRIINNKRNLYGIKKDGYLIPINLVVQQIPSLIKGVEYVGMLNLINSDAEYIMTNINGVIDGISRRVSKLMGIKSPDIFKQNKVNIQILCPELIKLFHYKKTKTVAKYKEIGGTEINIIIPKYFYDTYTSKHHKKGRGKVNIAKKLKAASYDKYNDLLNQGKIQFEINKKKFLDSDEYLRGEKKLKFRCEVQDQCFYVERDNKVLELKLFKLVGGSLRQGEEVKDESTIRLEVDEKDSFIVENDKRAVANAFKTDQRKISTFYNYVLAESNTIKNERLLSESREKLNTSTIKDPFAIESILKFSKISDPALISSTIAQLNDMAFKYPVSPKLETKLVDEGEISPLLPSDDEGSFLGKVFVYDRGSTRGAGDVEATWGNTSPRTDPIISEDVDLGIISGGSELGCNSEGGHRQPLKNLGDELKTRWSKSSRKVDHRNKKDIIAFSAGGSLPSHGSKKAISHNISKGKSNESIVEENKESEISVSFDINSEGERNMFDDNLIGLKNKQAECNPFEEIMGREPDVIENKELSSVSHSDFDLDELEEENILQDIHSQIFTEDSKRSKASYTQSEPPPYLEEFQGFGDLLLEKNERMNSFPANDLLVEIVEEVQSSHKESSDSNTSSESEKDLSGKRSNTPHGIQAKLSVDKSESERVQKTTKSVDRVDNNKMRRTSILVDKMQCQLGISPKRIIVGISEEEKEVLFPRGPQFSPGFPPPGQYKKYLSEEDMSVGEYAECQRLLKQTHRRIITHPDTLPLKYQPSIQESSIGDDEIRLRKSFLALAIEQQKEIEKIQSSPNDQPSENSNSSHNKKSDKDESNIVESGTTGRNKDDVASSVNSNSTSATLRGYSSINEALKEQYIPNYVNNIKIFVFLIFLSLIIASSVSLGYQASLYWNLDIHVKTIPDSELRISHITDINLGLTQLTLIARDITEENGDILMANETILDDTKRNKMEMYEQARIQIQNAGVALKAAQTKLSENMGKLPKSYQSQLMPENIEFVEYSRINKGVTKTRRSSLWNILFQIVVNIFSILEYEAEEIVYSDPLVQMILHNSMNSVFIALDMASEAIVDYINEEKTDVLKIFLGIDIGASISIFLVLVILILFICKVKSNRSHVLKLFNRLHIKHIDAIIKNIKKLRYTFQNDIDDEANDMNIFIEKKDKKSVDKSKDHKKLDEKGGSSKKSKKKEKGKRKIEAPIEEIKEVSDRDEEEGILSKNDASLISKRSKSAKKSTRFSRKQDEFKMNLHDGGKNTSAKIGAGLMILKIFIFALVSLVYFGLLYGLSKQFLGELAEVSKEFALLISQMPSHSISLLAEILIIGQNGTSMIKGQNSINFLNFYLKEQYRLDEDLLNMFEKNYDYHSDSYNKDFQNIVHESICEHVESIKNNAADYAECLTINEEMLTKGFYSTSIKYWDYTKQTIDDFLNSPRSQIDQRAFFNDDRLLVANRLESFYLHSVFETLIESIKEGIYSSFEQELDLMRGLFIGYLILQLLFYFIFWQLMIKDLQREIWNAKFMLQIIPSEYILIVPPLREYVLQNSTLSTMGIKKSS